jgi:hypothetical protein
MSQKNLRNLGVCPLKRYKNLADLIDLEDGISNVAKAEHFAYGHPNALYFLSNLGVCQLSRYQRLGQLTDLDDSISNLQNAVRLSEDGNQLKYTKAVVSTNEENSDMPMYLSDL